MEVVVNVYCKACKKEGKLKIKLGTTKEYVMKNGSCEYCENIGTLQYVRK